MNIARNLTNEIVKCGRRKRNDCGWKRAVLDKCGVRGEGCSGVLLSALGHPSYDTKR